MYNLEAYGAMIDDSVRMEAYEEAIRRVVTPDSVVLDIGAGLGIMSLLAARMGARRVVAVEPNPLVRIGARLAAENGLADRIHFVHGRSQQIEVEEKFDVVVGDLRGGLPNSHLFVDAVVDARERLMKPGGVLIPLRDTILAAPAQAEAGWSKPIRYWKENPFGLSMQGAVEAVVNKGATKVEAVDRLLSKGQAIAELGYLTVQSPNIDVQVELGIEESGTVHGISLWFETELIPGVGFSTAPNLEKTVYGRVFLPISQPTEVDSGCRVTVKIKEQADGDMHAWVWQGRISSSDGSVRSKFMQSSVFYNPESEGTMEVFHGDIVPRLTEDGELVREVLRRVDGRQRVAELAARTHRDHPDRFEYEEDAVNFVRLVLEQYGDAILRVGD